MSDISSPTVLPLTGHPWNRRTSRLAYGSLSHSTEQHLVLAGSPLAPRRRRVGFVKISTLLHEDNTWFASYHIDTPLSVGIAISGPIWNGATTREDAIAGALTALPQEIAFWRRSNAGKLEPQHLVMLAEADTAILARLAPLGLQPLPATWTDLDDQAEEAPTSANSPLTVAPVSTLPCAPPPDRPTSLRKPLHGHRQRQSSADAQSQFSLI